VKEADSYFSRIGGERHIHIFLVESEGVSIATTLPGNSMLLELNLVKWPEHFYGRFNSPKLKLMNQ
jgi:hypothetical protein